MEDYENDLCLDCKKRLCTICKIYWESKSYDDYKKLISKEEFENIQKNAINHYEKESYFIKIRKK